MDLKWRQIPPRSQCVNFAVNIADVLAPIFALFDWSFAEPPDRNSMAV